MSKASSIVLETPAGLFRWWLVFVTLQFLPVCFSATPSDTAAREYAFTNWRTQQGLLSNKISAVVQTRDGYMWIGTFEGLVRFDGVSFTNYDSNVVPAMRDSSVNCLYEGKDGTLWIGHGTGAVSSLRDGVFTTFPPRRDWKAGVIRGICSDEAGDIWIWDDTGDLARLRDGKVLKPRDGTAPGVRQITGSPDGKIWVTSRGRLSVLEQAEVSVVPLADKMNDYVQGVCASRDGSLWVVAEGQLWKLNGKKWTGPFGKLSSGPAPLSTVIELADGRLFAGTSENGAIVFTPEPWEEKRFWRATGFASDWVLSVAEDHEGGLWIGSGGAGLFRSRKEVIEMLSPPDHWQSRTVLTVAPATGGGLWVGTEGAGLYRWKGNSWVNYSREAGVGNPYVWTVAEDSEHEVWFGTGGGGLYHAIKGGFSRAPGFADVAPPMKAIQKSRTGGLWIGSLHGLFHYQNGVAKLLTDEVGSAARDVRAVLENPDGSLWIGSNGGGLFHLIDGKSRAYRKADGLKNEFVHALYLDAQQNLWIGTRSGLGRLKAGKFSWIGVEQGLPDGFICHIAEDSLGYLWISSHGGIFRVHKSELEACADGKVSRLNYLQYGLSDGLATLVCSGGLQPAGCTMEDGRLAFATDAGVAVVDPLKLTVNDRRAPVIIESVRGGDSIIANGSLGGQEVRVAVGTTRIELKYTGLSFDAPEKVRFKYKLEGLDKDWSDAQRERLAVYNYVPPGKYTFSVMAANNDNVWSESPAKLTLVILPHYWQTTWFKLSSVLLLIIVTAGIVWARARWRLKHALEKAERERAVELERARIARDMHDDLGAHLTRITMLSETAKRDPARAEDGLQKIYDTARNITRAMDEIVWAINPKHDSLESLVYYLEKFSLDFLGAARVRCRLEMPSEFPAWCPRSEVRHNLFLSLKEALHNAVRHSGADTVEVGMEMNEQYCRVFVRDNGNGNLSAPSADPENGRIASGNGLANMRERMRRIGGTCEIKSTPGLGTEVILLAPREVRTLAMTSENNWRVS